MHEAQTENGLPMHLAIGFQSSAEGHEQHGYARCIIQASWRGCLPDM